MVWCDSETLCLVSANVTIAAFYEHLHITDRKDDKRLPDIKTVVVVVVGRECGGEEGGGGQVQS